MHCGGWIWIAGNSEQQVWRRAASFWPPSDCLSVAERPLLRRWTVRRAAKIRRSSTGHPHAERWPIPPVMRFRTWRVTGSASQIHATAAGLQAWGSSAASLPPSRAVECLLPLRTAPVRSHSAAPIPHPLPWCSADQEAERRWVTRTSEPSAQADPPLFSTLPQVRDVSVTALRRGSPRECTPVLNPLRDSGHNGVKLPPPIR